MILKSNIPAEAGERYRGAAAATYDRDRTRGALRRFKWQREQQALDALSPTLGAGTTVLDLPTGTGRFLDVLTASGRTVIACDLSTDMLRQALARPHAPAIRFLAGDATRVPLGTGSVDWAVSMRFVNLIPREVLKASLAEMRRVARQGIVMQIRLRGGRGSVTNGVIRAVQLARSIIRTGKVPPRALPSLDEVDALLGEIGLRRAASHPGLFPLDSQHLMVLVPTGGRGTA